jgi:hypothetical protein
MRKEKLTKAVELYTAFHWGKLPKKAVKARIKLTDTFVYLGKLLGVIYLSDKDGSPKPYVHFFGKDEPLNLTCSNGTVAIEKAGKINLSEFPDLLTDETGKHLYIANFKGKVTERGIEG